MRTVNLAVLLSPQISTISPERNFPFNRLSTALMLEQKLTVGSSLTTRSNASMGSSKNLLILNTIYSNKNKFIWSKLLRNRCRENKQYKRGETK